MSGVLALLKILCVPILAAALNQTILLLAPGMGALREMQNPMLDGADAARAAFVVQAVIALVFTLFLGLPFFRFCARKNKSGYASWLVGWGLVHFPIAGLYLLGDNRNFFSASIASLIVSVSAVASLWWWWFYAERPVVSRHSSIDRGIEDE